MKEMLLREVWNLEGLFPGGSESHELSKHIDLIEANVNELESKVADFKTIHDVTTPSMIVDLLEQISKIRNCFSQANSFLICLLAQDWKDSKAEMLLGTCRLANARFEVIVKRLQTLLVKIEDDLWEDLLQTSEVQNYKFILDEWRQKAVMNLPESEENIVSSLMVDGYHAWGQLYQTLISDIKVPVSVNGEVKELSVGQAINLRSHADGDTRREAHLALEAILIEKEDLFAKILNHIAGFRLQVYKAKKVENILQEPLLDNRMKEETLQAMWSTINNNKQPFIQYLNKKAEIFGETKLSAYHFWAPVTEVNQHISYQEAVHYISEQFSGFGTELESFARKAFKEGWVEAENRPNKSPAAFCASFPETGESRVFMTYDGRFSNVLTLAHELGHAFHNYAMHSVNGLNNQYPLSLAETASTFSEMIVLESLLNKAASPEEKLFLLDEKLKRSVMNFMNIHSRFLFEQRFYEERKEGFVSSSRLNELMEEAMEEGYKGSLRNGSRHSWIWTPHYYITKSPFYNFPYTFGYLFSTCLYAKAKEKGKQFEKNYLSLLRDSGSISIEDLVMKHIGEDISSEAFWEKGLELCVKDVEEFLRLSEGNVEESRGIYTNLLNRE